MRILFFVQNLLAGGMERRLLELIRYLKRNEDYVMTLVIAEDDIHFNYARELGIPIQLIKRRNLRYDPSLFVRFCKFCKEFKPDIIHAWGRFATFNAIPAKIICRKPLISNLINNSKEDFRKNTLDRFFHKVDLIFADAVLSNSETGLKNYKVNSPKALVIRNGVHPERFEGKFDIKAEREKLNTETPYLVIMVARFTKSKDYDLFIDLARETAKIRSDVTFLGVGDGPELERIRKRVKDEQLKNVLLPGAKNEVEPLIAASDVGLLCTFSEGISNSVIEYMALGKPVIATDINGGSREIIVEGETGFCTERNAEFIIKQVNLLLNDENLRREMGKKGRDRILADFTIEKMGNDFGSLYRKVKDRRNGRKVQ